MSKTFRTIFFPLLYMLLCVPGIAGAEKLSIPPQVLIVHSSYEGYPWTDSLNRGIRDVFASAPESYEFMIEYIDFKRNHDPLYFKKLRTLWEFKYRNRRIDLIIACDNEAYDFILEGRENLFRNIPLVFTGVSSFIPESLEGKENITGVVEENDIAATIDVALRLHPRTKKVVFVTPGAPPSRMAWLEGLPARYKNRIEVLTITTKDMAAVDTELVSLGPDIIMIPLNSGVDASGTYLSFNDFVSYLAKEAPFPVYALWDIALGEGVVGGKMVTGELQGREAAKLALQILRGTPVSDVPVLTHSPNQYMFDWKQLQRFNVSLSDLPKDAVVIHRPVSFYRANKSLVQITVGGIVVLILLIILLGSTVVNLKRVQKKLLLSDEILKQMPDGVILTDLEGNIQRWMGKAEDIFGYSADEVTGRPVHIIHQPKMRDSVAGRIRDGLQRTGSFAGEISCMKKDGMQFPVELTATTILDDTGFPICIIRVNKDISERKRTEDALRESEFRLKKMIQKSPLPMVITDKNQDISLFNDKFSELFGYTTDDVSTGDDWWKLAYPDETYRATVQQAWSDAIEKAAATNTDIAMQVWDLTIKNRSRRTCEFYMVPLGDFSLIIINDITDRLQLETQLLQAQRMEAIGTLAGGIAHDFNNILTAIIGFTELAAYSAEKDSPLKGYLQEILGAGNRAKKLVQQILTFARHSQSEVQPIQVRSIAKEVAKFIRSSIPATIAINQNVETDAMVLADPTQLYQIFMNLFTNASQAMEENGGCLTVSIEDVHVEQNNTIENVILPAGDWVVIKVKDTGIGMPEHVLKKIFDPYFTTKKLGEGTGLGLSVVYGAVKNMHGKITVASQEGNGTLFTLYLPKFEEDEIVVPPSFPGIDCSGTEKILVVDDERPVTNLLREICESYGYEVIEKNDPLEALQYFMAHHDSIDLVITDMTMPGMTGDELTRRLLEIKNPLPIICCTGFSKKIDQEKAKELGMTALLRKPLSQSTLLSTIREALDA